MTISAARFADFIARAPVTARLTVSPTGRSHQAHAPASAAKAFISLWASSLVLTMVLLVTHLAPWPLNSLIRLAGHRDTRRLFPLHIKGQEYS